MELKVGQVVRSDGGAHFRIVSIHNGWALAESLRHGARVYVLRTGRTWQRMPGGSWGVRVAIYRAVDIGLIRFHHVAETLRPAERPECGGFAYIA